MIAFTKKDRPTLSFKSITPAKGFVRSEIEGVVEESVMFISRLSEFTDESEENMSEF